MLEALRRRAAPCSRLSAAATLPCRRALAPLLAGLEEDMQQSVQDVTPVPA
jgi:hypothetical protein